jgi:hypothetical protein
MIVLLDGLFLVLLAVFFAFAIYVFPDEELRLFSARFSPILRDSAAEGQGRVEQG